MRRLGEPGALATGVSWLACVLLHRLQDGGGGELPVGRPDRIGPAWLDQAAVVPFEFLGKELDAAQVRCDGWILIMASSHRAYLK
jgi:hypothetical protein